MATAPSSKTRRRPGQACDSCHKKKTRCYWRAPACADCIRLKIACTFERSQASCPDETWKRARRNEDGSTILQGLSEPVSTHEPTRLLDASIVTAEAGAESGFLSPGEVQQAIKCYFSHVNHFFPILSRGSFETWANDGNDNDGAFRTCFNSFVCSSLHYEQLACPELSNDRRGAYWEYLGEALTNYGNLSVSTPSLHIVQALASLVFCVQRGTEGAAKSLAILAVAVRFAYRLNLHHLDEEDNLSVADRLERLRLFWCLYILDRSTSLRLHLPPLIDDRDLYVLTPKMFSEDGLGLVRALNSPATLNLFTARQRLAVISGRIWTSLYTSAGKRQPSSARIAAQEELQRRLLDWKEEWFYVDHPNTQWPPSHLVSIMHLQFEYFRSLLKTDPDVFPVEDPKTIGLMGEDSSYIQHLRTTLRNGTGQWVDAARETLRLATVVRRGGLKYLQYASHHFVPAILILSTAISRNADRQQAEADRELARLWLDLFQYVAQTGVENPPVDLGAVLRVFHSLDPER